MFKLSVEHIALFILAAFLLYHLTRSCGCANSIDGFNIGGQNNPCPKNPEDSDVTKWQNETEFRNCQCPEDWTQQQDGKKDQWRCIKKICPKNPEALLPHDHNSPSVLTTIIEFGAVAPPLQVPGT